MIPEHVKYTSHFICNFCNSLVSYDEIVHCLACDEKGCSNCIPSNYSSICPNCQTSPFSQEIKPMLAQLSKELPSDEDNWCFEYKWDGIRSLLFWDGKSLKIKSRNLIDVTAHYPEFSRISKFIRQSVILDGEIVVLDEKGIPSFSKLQKRMHLKPSNQKRLKELPVFLFIFDILYWNGNYCTESSYLQRRIILNSLQISYPFHVPPAYRKEGKRILQNARNIGVEGIIAKRADSTYETGKRSMNWKKIKIVQTLDLIIGGYTLEKNSDKLGSLSLGYFNSAHQLIFAGSVGTGFDDKLRKYLMVDLDRLKATNNVFYPPFKNKSVIPVTPDLVAEVEYRRISDKGILEQASFKGIRMDKSADEIVMEELS